MMEEARRTTTPPNTGWWAWLYSALVPVNRWLALWPRVVVKALAERKARGTSITWRAA